jgi:Bromodomain
VLLNYRSLNRETLQTMADLMDVQDSVNLDDYGSPSSSSSSAASLYSVMSTLYCLSIAADFRKPVEVLYPNIANSYLSVIKNPMDLGTLLLECMKGNATVNSIRQGLRLVFSNSLLFNAGSPMMEAISQHLESFASGLFEEATRLPFNEKKPLLRDFNEELIYRRSYRLNSVCRIPLKEIEVRCIENVLLAVQEKLPMELEEAMANMMETILKYYNSVGSKDHSDDIAPILTLELIFKPFLEATRAPHPMLLSAETEGYTVLPSLVGLLGIPIGLERTHTRTHSLPLQLQPMTSIPISHMSSNDMRQLTSAPSLTSLSKMESNMMPVDCLLSVDMIGARTAESVQNQDQILHLSNLPLNPTIPHTHNAMSNVSAIVNNGDSSNNNNNSSSSSSSGSNSNNISDNTNINGNGNGNGNTIDSQKNNYSPILPSTLPYLTALDDRLGSLCVRLEERLLRGTNHSSVWQRPLALMWAQPAKVRFVLLLYFFF